MTTITVKINERTKAGKAFIAMAESFFKNAEGIEIIEESSENISKKPVKLQSKTKAIRELSKEINKKATHRMLQTHGLL